MKTFSTALQNALLNREIVFRDFLWLVPRVFGTTTPFPYGFWSDAGSVSAAVINPLTQQSETRDFEGAGSLISISDIPAVSNITVQNVTISLSQIQESVANIVRGYDLKQARVEIYSGYFSPATQALIEPAFCRFQGFVDDAQIQTPVENQTGSITLTCTSHTSELTRSNPDTRSDDSQRVRASQDGFYKDVAAVGDWDIFWGQHTGSTS